jgi:hypothetical protein
MYGNTFPPETEIGQSCILFAKILYVSTPMRGVLLNYHPSQSLLVLKFRVTPRLLASARGKVSCFVIWV